MKKKRTKLALAMDKEVEALCQRLTDLDYHFIVSVVMREGPLVHRLYKARMYKNDQALVAADILKQASAD